jgi:putative MATE family efflux protein
LGFIFHFLRFGHGFPHGLTKLQIRILILPGGDHPDCVTTAAGIPRDIGKKSIYRHAPSLSSRLMNFRLPYWVHFVVVFLSFLIWKTEKFKSYGNFMEDKKFGRDLTVGSIPKHLISFSLPMLLGNMLHSGYSIINMIWVGHIVGADGLGATAVSFPIMFILIGIAAGVSMATAVLVAQFYGAKKMDKLTMVVDNSVLLQLILSVVLITGMIALSNPLLRLMDTPPEIFPMASSYLKISLAGIIFLYLSFTISQILRGLGDTMRPLLFMGTGVILNAILDPFLIIGIFPFPRLGLNGAALASVISQAVSLAIAVAYLNRKSHLVSINFRRLKFDRHITWLIARIGFPSTIEQCLISVGSAFVTKYVNFFGPAAIAAFGAGSRIDMVGMMPAIAIGMAATALTGQNLGAGKPERVKEIFKSALWLGTLISGVVAVFAFAFPKLILSMFTQSEPVLLIGVQYLRIVAPCYLLFALMFVSMGVVNGAGQTIVPMLLTLVSLWAVRVPVAWYLSEHTALKSAGIWIAMAAGFVVTAIIGYLYYLTGRWQKSASKIHLSNVALPSEDAASG